MLLELKVSHFAIIENIHIQFGDGLNILSGETGSGKSVLLKSLSLLMGVKGSSEQIRTGFTQASVEGLFDLSERPDLQARLKTEDLASDDRQLIVRRLIVEDKSRVYINGNLSTLAVLRELVAPLVDLAGQGGSPLIEITSQHDNRNLLSRSYHIELLDQFAGSVDLLRSYQTEFQKLQRSLDSISRLREQSLARESELDFLHFQKDEISKIDFSPGLDLELEVRVKTLRNQKKLADFLGYAEELLVAGEASVSAQLNDVIHRGEDSLFNDLGIQDIFEQLSIVQASVEEHAEELRRRLSLADLEEESIDDLEAKLSQLKKLKKKYGPELSDVLQSLVTIENKIFNLESLDDQLSELEKNRGALTLSVRDLGEKLYQRRKKEAGRLEKAVNAQLAELNMKGVQFRVSLERVTEPHHSGLEAIEFQIQTSAKDVPRSLNKIASGGELSRILLSLKTVIGKSQFPRTYLFDEVDSGVSGETADKVGRKLSEISSFSQVICITHLPQVAAFADQHFLIQKNPEQKSVSMKVSRLEATDRAQEIARLISGEKLTKTSLAHAKQLLAEAKR